MHADQWRSVWKEALRHRRPAALAGLALLLAGNANAEPERLAAYSAPLSESSASGVSSGAFMAVQLATAWSSLFKGVGIIAGGPFYCAEGTALGALTGENLRRAQGPCMAGPAPAIEPLLDAAEEWARAGAIDPLQNLAVQRVYLFAGTRDGIVARSVVDAARRFALHFAAPDRVFFQDRVPAGHAMVTRDWGGPCGANGGAYIDACAYDQAGVLLQHFYGALLPPGADAEGRLVQFDQREFTRPAAPASYSLAETGYAFVPASCARHERCRVHVALHGCKQNAAAIGEAFVRHAGYNGWAAANRIIVLYPQTAASDPMMPFGTPFNPNGCWDWWGYTNFQYATQAGRQVAVLKAMVDRLTAGAEAAPAPSTAAAPRLAAIDSSAGAIALAWTATANAIAYRVERAPARGGRFEPVGTTDALGFVDGGRPSGTAWRYRVVALRGGETGLVSDAVTAATR